MKAPESLYNRIEEVRRKFKEQNGIDITMIQASEFMGRRMRTPNVPNLINNRRKRR